MSESDPTVFCATLEEWEAWLGENHERVRGVWLKIAKKGVGNRDRHATRRRSSWRSAHGWIDGRAHGPRRRASSCSASRPRRARSRWSKINRDKAEQLIDAGPHDARRPARGRAGQGGRPLGRRLRSRSATSPSPTICSASSTRDPKARRFFESLSSQNRYAILYRLHDAKKPETRERRLTQFVAMLKEGKTLHP